MWNDKMHINFLLPFTLEGNLWRLRLKFCTVLSPPSSSYFLFQPLHLSLNCTLVHAWRRYTVWGHLSALVELLGGLHVDPPGLWIAVSRFLLSKSATTRFLLFVRCPEWSRCPTLLLFPSLVSSSASEMKIDKVGLALPSSNPNVLSFS